MTFRSIQMAHFRLFLPRENYYQSIQELLYLGNVHVVDIGNPLNRPFYPQIKRCDELLSKISTIIEAMKVKKIKIQQYDQQDPNYIEQLSDYWNSQANKLGVQKSKLLDHYQNEIFDHWHKFNQKRSSIEKLINNQKSVLSKMACFQALERFFGEGRQIGDLMIGGNNGISIMVGVVDPAAQLKLSRTIYRISRGFAFLKGMDQFNFHALKGFGQKAMILVYPNSTTGVLQKKLTKVMQTFCNSLIQFQEGSQPLVEMNKSRQQFDEVMNILTLNDKEMKQLLQNVKKRKCLQTWRTFIWKQKAIYECLNKMQLRQNFIIFEAYIPKSQRPKLDNRLKMISPAPQFQQIQVTKPPTAFNTNCYTRVAQEITNTYGVPRYQEINPSIFTSVTFPFFFGVMFGDIGHGLVLFILGLYLVFNNEKIKKTSFAFASDLRYIVLMMGFFAFYCGWIYNDFLGMNLNIFGSCYQPQQVAKQIYISPKPDCVYPFGIDPIWGISANELVFVNALKMKISVIIAIVHMSLGVCIKCFNALYFKKKMDVYFQFIPQILFLVLLFGYMDFLIIFKWLTKWNCSINATKTGMECFEPFPPSVISTMMDIGLQVGSTDKAGSMWGEKGNSSQDIFQMFILLVAFISIPVMLLPKPIMQIRSLKNHEKDNPLLQALQDNVQEERHINKSQDFDQIMQQKQDVEAHQQHDAGQIFVHQLIETIEFVLGAISNTASYLRLWALSLAHSQLAKVFFNKTLQLAFTFQTALLAIVAMPILFYMLVWVTFGVLMCMDTMECFLHSLRLHWVQFQNKFYKGDGYLYEPAEFKKYLLDMKKKSSQ